MSTTGPPRGEIPRSPPASRGAPAPGPVSEQRPSTTPSRPADARDVGAALHAPSAAGFGWFAVGVGSWFGGWGMQQVLFSWIVVGELAADAEWVGIAQTSTMLPSTFLLLAGGAVADRFDPRRLLAVLHVVAAIPAALLAIASAQGWLSLGVLVAYGLFIGTVQAFSMPARDTLLSRVAGPDMMRAVTTMTAAQFGSQATGALIAGLARLTGSAAMLTVQAGVFLLGAFVQRGVPPAPRPARPPSSDRTPIAEILEGLRIVARTDRLWAPAVLVVAVGVFFIGPYVVVFPLLVRDYYGLGVGSLSIVLMLFPLGTIAGSLVLRARGIGRKGGAALLALVCGASIEAVIGLGVPYWGLVVLTLLWGVGGAVFINCSRTLYQEAAPSEQRGRVLAVYQLGFMGGAPIGTFLAGFAVAWLGLHGTLLVASAAMLALVTAMATLTRTARMR